MKEIKKLIAVFIAAIFFIGLFIICDRFAENVKDEYASQIDPSLRSSTTKEGASTGSAQDIAVESMAINMVSSENSMHMNLGLTGDILVQSQQLKSSYDSESDSFDFSNAFSQIKDELGKSDFLTGTLKTTMAGSGNGYSDSFVGYCASDGMYNTPEVFARNLKDAGFSLLNTATNHSLDSGSDGLVSTLKYLDEASLQHVGTRSSSTGSMDYILTSGSARIAFTGYTWSAGAGEGTDQQSSQDLSEDSYSEDLYEETAAETAESSESAASSDNSLVNSLKEGDDSKISAMVSHIQELKKANDFVVVMLNFESSDSSRVDSSQKSLAEKIAGAGADLIVGTGSRCVRPMEVVTATGEDGLQRQCLVFYGLGALYSSEYYQSYEDLDVDISAIVDLTISTNASGQIGIRQVRIVPVYLNWYNGLVQPVPVCEAKDTNKYADLLDDDDMARIDSAYEETAQTILSGTGLTAQYQDYGYNVTLQ